MIQVLSKEFNSFLNSLIAYVVIGVFLVATGLLLWVFPDTSVLDYGYADLTTLFALGPYVFIFLVPAITTAQLCRREQSGHARATAHQTAYRLGHRAGQVPWPASYWCSLRLYQP